MYVLMLTEEEDASNNKIAHWISYLSDAEIIRINETDHIQITNIHVEAKEKTHFSLIINKHLHIDSKEITSYWYRRGRLNMHRPRPKAAYARNSYRETIYDSVSEFYGLEWDHISGYLHYLLRRSGINSINSYSDLQSNRLINAEIAKSIGLNIPDSIVTNSPGTIRQFLKRHSSVITKCIFYPGLSRTLAREIFSYSTGTRLFTTEHLNAQLIAHKTFQPTLFQEYIHKEFEIRSFYLQGELHSMAIFSQSNEQTTIDFRNYDRINPNRNVPFLLPSDMEVKLKSLMETLELDTGSIDLIYNNGKYYFLEVNTVGQFDWVSKQCNYFIEKQIARKLTNTYGNN